jgi:CPA1 family monovalent cation:H+ antiporter
MPNAEVILGLLLGVVVLTTLARQLDIAYPILLVLGGLVVGFIPSVPSVALPPSLVLVLFLPPLLYWESLNLSYRDLRFSIRPILSLAIGLVLATIVAVAVVAHSLIPGFTWAMAFVLGTIVGPTDEVAVAAIAERLPLPTRLLALIEDESLLNDASSLVAYNVAVAAVVTGTFSLTGTGLQVLAAAIGGIAIGLAVGWAIVQLRRRLDDPPVENTISLLTGFAAYLPADALHLSGVLAVVTTGIYVSRQGPRIISPRTRLQNREMWEIADFLLNGVLFILVGLQLHSILGRLSTYQPRTLFFYAVIIVLTVILLRVVWVFPATYLPRLLFPEWAKTRPGAPWQQSAIVAWSGMRGAVSLAAALAIPFVINGGARFPDRELIIFLTFAVILSTLVFQGLTLPVMIRRLGIPAGQDEKHEELAARLAATQAGLERLNSSAGDGLPGELMDGLRKQLQDRSRKFVEHEGRSQSRAQRTQSARYRRLLAEILDAERNAVLDLRDQGVISDDVMRRVQRELDLEEVRLEPEEGEQPR